MTSVLIQAINNGDLAAVIAALEAGADIEAADVHGQAGLPLRTACFHGHPAIVSELLKRGADVRGCDYDGCGAPVRAAVRGQHPDIVRLLLEHGAELPAGLNVGLSHEAIFQAQLVATICQRSRLDASIVGEASLPDHEVREFFVSPEELERLFGKPVKGVRI